MRAYVINLNDRGDRWNSVLSQQDLLGLEIVRVEAVSKLQITASEEPFVAPGVSATWKSHQKAMQIFLDSDEEFGLIMEDGFLIKRNFNRHFARIRKYDDFDFIQLGILKPSSTSGIALLTSNARDIFLKIVCKITVSKYLQHNPTLNRVLIHEQQGVPFFLVCSDVRAGGQAYLVSRNFATAAQKMNQPAFLSSDGVYMSIGGMRSFRMFRLRKSLVKQTNSPTSVESRFRLH
jgi:GR25 family glycosyltransferase involved in LPS biosynthesis